MNVIYVILILSVFGIVAGVIVYVLATTDILLPRKKDPPKPPNGNFIDISNYTSGTVFTRKQPGPILIKYTGTYGDITVENKTPIITNKTSPFLDSYEFQDNTFKVTGDSNIQYILNLPVSESQSNAVSFSQAGKSKI